MRPIAEAKFTDKTPLGKVLEKYRGQGLWIHFTNPQRADRPREDGLPALTKRSPDPVPKLGVNPKKHHLDPPGVYFYPIDWLLGHKKFIEGSQWATNWPHYVIADIDTSGQGINLSTITAEEVEELAQRNGWSKEWEEHNSDPRSDKDVGVSMWALLKTLNQRGREARRSWLSTLRGAEYIVDYSGTIMSFEPQQICVINPRIITIVERGTQPQIEEHDYNNFAHWRYLIVNLFDDLKNQHGGEIVWRNKFPEWKSKEGDWSIEVNWNNSYSAMGLWITMWNGQVSDNASLPVTYLRDHEYSDILEKINDFVAEAKKMTPEDFNPVIDPEDAKLLLRKVAQWQRAKPEVEIRARSSSFVVSVEQKNGRIPVTSLVRISADEESYTIRCEVKINDNYVLYGSGNSEEAFKQNVFNMFKRKMEELTDQTRYDCIDDEYAEAFVGYIYTCTGLAMLSEYENNFYEANTAELYRQIERTFRRIGW